MQWSRNCTKKRNRAGSINAERNIINVSGWRNIKMQGGWAGTSSRRNIKYDEWAGKWYCVVNRQLTPDNNGTTLHWSGIVHKPEKAIWSIHPTWAFTLNLSNYQSIILFLDPFSPLALQSNSLLYSLYWSSAMGLWCGMTSSCSTTTPFYPESGQFIIASYFVVLGAPDNCYLSEH